MRVSVITVTYNSLAELRKTYKSVMRQVGVEFEYIIVDGNSVDGTKDYLEHSSSDNVHWISEPDKGIYEAMNKGARLAHGEYCIYMNAGDCFVNNSVLRSVDPFLDGSEIVLGNQVHLNAEGCIDNYTPSYGEINLESIFKISLRHQSCFIKRSVLLLRPYDESLRLVSDWKFFLEWFLSGDVTYKTINLDVCFFRGGGATDKNKELGKAERISVLAHYPEYKHIWSSPYRLPFFKRIIRKLLFFYKYIQYNNVVKGL